MEILNKDRIVPQIKPKNADIAVNCNVTKSHWIIKGILCAILLNPKLELLVFDSVPLFSNHFFTSLSISPLCFICAKTRLKSSTLAEPWGKAMAEPASSVLLAKVLNSKSGLLAIKPVAMVFSIIAPSIRPALTYWIISDVLLSCFSLTSLNFWAAFSWVEPNWTPTVLPANSAGVFRLLLFWRRLYFLLRSKC